MLVLKHLYTGSFEECERQVRGSLIYRAFCRIDCERVPDAKTVIRLAHTLESRFRTGQSQNRTPSGQNPVAP